MNAKTLTCKVAGVGAWGANFENWHDLQALLCGQPLPDKPQKGPKPAIIPANERRRAPLPVRLAVESSWQAVQHAQVEPASLTNVFVSGLGDTDLTDYMCKVLASENKELSPTKFHNSVHNAAAGYWTISTNTMTAANSVAGYQESVSLALFEAMVQCEAEGVPMLVTFYDAPVSEVLKPLLENTHAFAFSLVLFPSVSDHGMAISATIREAIAPEWPTLSAQSDYLQSLYTSNPCARVLSLAEMLMQQNAKHDAITMPLSEQTTISFERVQP
ncbi:hypothetical protein DRW07_16075 [Alteromonas sediminis]|uniref:Beta-ketoacyl synthase-like N-terminal domain-containing protein n=1 Tax=Alteromonas sediminis TaxID=2259342 RepID=A0A3N5Y5B7_9ALTE|nr:beta-ketoacyl synthase chain length factor [Alteromonas sediminis]RPJ65419.1 hypothetical protein DRW07_16075 [Alteromonas sediminis]